MVAKRREAAMLAKAEVKAGKLALEWRNEAGPAEVSLFWLRDHCTCPTCLHPDTKQRQVDTFAIPADIAARRVELAENGRQLVVEWAADGHVSRFDAAQLAAWLRGDHAEEPVRVLWDQARVAAAVPQVAY